MTEPKFNPQRVSTLPAAEATTTCIYGASGAGKTDLAASAGSDTLILNIGQGIETLKSADFKKRRKSDPIVITIDEKQAADKTYTGFYGVCEAIDEALKIDSSGWNHIVLDDLSYFRKFAMNTALDMNSESSRSQTKSSAEKWGAPLLAMQDFGTEMNLIEWFFGTYIPILRAHKKHFIVVAHDRLTYSKQKKGEESKLLAVSPNVTGADKNPDGFALHFDNVWRCYKVGREGYRLQTQGDAIYRAKTRIGGVLKEVEENPNFADLLKRLQGQGGNVASKL